MICRICGNYQPIIGHDTLLAGRTGFFFKQVGGATPKAGGRELDGRTWDEMPTVEPAFQSDNGEKARAALSPREDA
jgi:hypothetical protein